MKKLLLPLAVALCCAPLAACAMNQTTYTYDNAEQYTMGGTALRDSVRNLDIGWISGDVTIQRHSKDTVEFSETANRDLDETNTLYYWLDGDTLRIRFAQSGKPNISRLSKALTVSLPENLALDDVCISTVSASIHADNIAAETANFETVSGAMDMIGISVPQGSRFSSVSGAIHAGNCTLNQNACFSTTSGAIYARLSGDLEEITLKSVSGKIDASLENAGLLTAGSTSGNLIIAVGDAEIIQANNTSGTIELTLKQASGSGKISTTSGKVTLCMPEGAGFTADTGSISGRVVCEPQAQVIGKRYIVGDGKCLFKISTVSGGILLKTAHESP